MLVISEQKLRRYTFVAQVSRTFLKTIVEASVKVKFAYVYNNMMTYSAHLHTYYEHAQNVFLPCQT
jgi:hypothetical protein